MSSQAQGWAALREGLGAAWLLVALVSVAGFWSVHEPGSGWQGMVRGASGGFLFLVVLSTLLFADLAVRVAVDADLPWVRAAITISWAVVLVASVPVAAVAGGLPERAATMTLAIHLWLAGLTSVCASLMLFHLQGGDPGQRFYRAVGFTALALVVWVVQAAVLGAFAVRAIVADLALALAVVAFLLGAGALSLRTAEVPPPAPPTPEQNAEE